MGRSSLCDTLRRAARIQGRDAGPEVRPNVWRRQESPSGFHTPAMP